MAPTVKERDIIRLRKRISVDPSIRRNRIADAINACRMLLERYPSKYQIRFIEAAVRRWMKTGHPKWVKQASIFEDELLDFRLQEKERKELKKKQAQVTQLASTVSATPPPGATLRVPGSDGKMHWSDGANDLGVVVEQTAGEEKPFKMPMPWADKDSE